MYIIIMVKINKNRIILLDNRYNKAIQSNDALGCWIKYKQIKCIFLSKTLFIEGEEMRSDHNLFSGFSHRNKYGEKEGNER